MDILHSYTDLPVDARGAVVALGAFDGAHRGHQAIFAAARELAATHGRPMGVVTFNPHPRRVLDPEAVPFRILNNAARLDAFARYGVNMAWVLPFDLRFAGLSPDVFIEKVIVEGLQATAVVVGENFRFGYQRQGTPELLQRLGAALGFKVVVVPSLRGTDGVVYSSTAVRQALREGRIQDANTLLGRPWEVSGEVASGDRRGTELGFPTANIIWGDYIVPRYGVYAVQVSCRRITWRPAVANIGVRPTIGDDLAPRLEVHVFDYRGDLYGEKLNVRIMDFLRTEQKFASLADLQAQIARDCEAARTILEPVST
jgi:riboflavin kinase / FMN adenylyltransferase